MLYNIKRILIVTAICLLAAGGLRLHTQIQRIDERVSYSSVDVVSLIARLKESVVYIEAPEWSGSGVIIGPHRVLTAKHVIEYAGDLTIVTDANEEYEAMTYTVDFDNDCGLLHVKEELNSTVQLGDSNSLQIGEQVLIIGSPFDEQHFNTVTLGIISGLERDIPYFSECKLFTVDAASWGGNSGGPVFNMRGEIVGLLIGGYSGYDNLSVVIPINICKELLID